MLSVTFPPLGPHAVPPSSAFDPCGAKENMKASLVPSTVVRSNWTLSPFTDLEAWELPINDEDLYNCIPQMNF